MAQIPCDPGLLREMMADMRRSDPLSQPGQYWEHYCNSIATAIEEHGLDDFRSPRSDSRFDGFQDVHIFVDYLASYRFLRRMLTGPLSFLKSLPRIGRQFTVLDAFEGRLTAGYQNQTALAYHLLRAEAPNEPLDKIEDSGLGRPIEYKTPGGKRYALEFLNKFDKYLTVKKSVDFSQVKSFMELGGGYGCMAEVVMKLHPDMTYFILDIAPQLFISQSYLKAIFGDRVMTYEETKQHKEITPELLKRLNKSIVMVASWELEKIKVPCDMLFTDYAIMEMDLQIIRSYARRLNGIIRRHVFISDRLGMQGGSSVKTLKQSMSMQDVIGCFADFAESRRLPFRHLARLHSDASVEANVALSRVRDAVAAPV
jgi:putative sugar O-methyltransferase